MSLRTTIKKVLQEEVKRNTINEQGEFMSALMKRIMDTIKDKGESLKNDALKSSTDNKTESKPLGIGVVGSGWKSCKAWREKGGLSKWGDKIQISKSSSNFTISYKGPSSGLSIAHAAGGGDTIHQLYNVLICEINPFLSTTKAKPNIKNIQVSGGKEGGQSTLKISVPLESSDEHYQLDRRGGWNHDPGSSKMDEKCKKVKNSGGKCEGSVRNIATGPFGKITEYFITHTM